MVGVTPWLGSAALLLALGPATVSEPEAPNTPPEATDTEPDPEPDVTAPSGADKSVAAAAAARAQSHFRQEQWDQAVEALMEAYAADPNPAYLYARAQAERMRGNCRAANALYERFLDSEPTETQRADTERHIRLCEEILFNESVESQPEPEPEPEPEPPATTDEPPPVDEPPPGPRPWYRDPLGLTLVVGGTGAVAAGATLWALGDRDRQQAPQAPTEEEYERTESQGKTRIAIGASVAGAGVALIIGGAVRLGLQSRRSLRTSALWLPAGGGVALRGRF